MFLGVKIFREAEEIIIKKEILLHMTKEEIHMVMIDLLVIIILILMEEIIKILGREI